MATISKVPPKPVMQKPAMAPKPVVAPKPIMQKPVAAPVQRPVTTPAQTPAQKVAESQRNGGILKLRQPTTPMPNPMPYPEPPGGPIYEPLPENPIFNQPNMPGGKGGFMPGGPIPDMPGMINPYLKSLFGTPDQDIYDNRQYQQQPPQPFNANPNPVSNMGAGQMPTDASALYGQPTNTSPYTGQLDLSGMMNQPGQQPVPTNMYGTQPSATPGGKSSGSNASYGGGKSR